MRKEELALLRDDDLLHLARNPSSNCRADAVRLLVERSSPHANHPEIAVEAAGLVHADPLILKKMDPASAIAAHKLPGLLDVLAKDVKDTRALEQKAGVLEQNLARTGNELRGSLTEKEQALRKQHEELRENIGGQLSALCQKLSETAAGLSQSQANSATALERKQKEIEAGLLQQLGVLFQTHALYGKRITDSEDNLKAAEARIARLERSVWRKFWDWVKGR